MEIVQEDEDEEGSQVLDEDGNPTGDLKDKKNKKKTFLKFKENDGQKTLESAKNITVTSFDTSHEVDPLFKKTTMKFDEMKLGSLMSSTLSTTSSLLLQLDSQAAYSSNLLDQATSRRQSEQSGSSSKNTKLVKTYIDIFRNTFDGPGL